MNNHSPKIEKSYTNEKVISEKLKIFSEKDREDNLEKIRRIILESAMEQFIKENELNKINDFNENLKKSIPLFLIKDKKRYCLGLSEKFSKSLYYI